jgi:hypothetical protein
MRPGSEFSHSDLFPPVYWHHFNFSFYIKLSLWLLHLEHSSSSLILHHNKGIQKFGEILIGHCGFYNYNSFCESAMIEITGIAVDVLYSEDISVESFCYSQSPNSHYSCDSTECLCLNQGRFQTWKLGSGLSGLTLFEKFFNGMNRSRYLKTINVIIIKEESLIY